jgi:hypothetical protein
VLAIIASVFDPLGLIALVVIAYKIFMQTLWQVKLEWYEKLPQPLQLQWENLYDQLPAINDICINQRVLVTDMINIEIHGFCDSSERVYTACIYLRYTKCKQRNDSWTFVLQI